MKVDIENMSDFLRCRFVLLYILLFVFSASALADVNYYREARGLQRSGDYNRAVEMFQKHLLQDVDATEMSETERVEYVDALVQLMNTYQSMGKPVDCIIALQDVYDSSPLLQKQYLRDFHSVLGYALSRTENMEDAEKSILKVFTLPLYHTTHERLFRDYAYAAAVFYSNPKYHKEVMYWCEQALKEADLCKNTSSKQWVTTMLGSLCKRYGYLNRAIELYLLSRDEARKRSDNLGELNSLVALTSLFLYWDVPEYADLYASEAIMVENDIKKKNPMVSAQAYIQKGWAMYSLGRKDSVYHYTDAALKFCHSLPYNSGMVDVELLHGYMLAECEGDSLLECMKLLTNVTLNGTDINRAKALHKLAQIHLKHGEKGAAEEMLDSMYMLIYQSDHPFYIDIDYEAILSHYMQTKNIVRMEQYAKLMNDEKSVHDSKELKTKIAKAILNYLNERKERDSRIAQLEVEKQRLYFFIYAGLSILVIFTVVALLFNQKKLLRVRQQQADIKLSSLTDELNKVADERDKIEQEVEELLSDMKSRMEIETLTPSMLQKSGETKFRQRFEQLYPLFLPRLREQVPNISRREELLSMLIVLKQDNKEIADLMAIAPGSVLMLRHRFRQKLSMNTEESLEDFINAILVDMQ